MVLDSLLSLAGANPFMNPFHTVKCSNDGSTGCSDSSRAPVSHDERIVPVRGRNIMAAAAGELLEFFLFRASGISDVTWCVG